MGRGSRRGTGRLETPFYRAEDKLTTLTARESSIPLMDIDGDGMVEWPLSSRLPGYETVDAADALWKTTWMTWDYATRQSRQVFSCVMNERDGYYVLFDESWDGKVTAIYDRDTVSCSSGWWGRKARPPHSCRSRRPRRANRPRKRARPSMCCHSWAGYSTVCAIRKTGRLP